MKDSPVFLGNPHRRMITAAWREHGAVNKAAAQSSGFSRARSLECPFKSTLATKQNKTKRENKAAQLSKGKTEMLEKMVLDTRQGQGHAPRD